MTRSTAVLPLVLSFGLFFVGCDEQPTAVQPDETTGPDALAQQTAQGPAANQGQPNLQKQLATVREATSKYQDVEAAKDDGYQQTSPFVSGMGFHYVKGSLLADGNNIDITQPEALVYDSNDPNQKTRNLGAVEYVVPDPGKNISQGDLPTPFSGQTTDDWHYEHEIGSWTLHVWVWLDNPEGVFHPTNPRVTLDS